MSEPNPYQSPEELSGQTTAQTRPASALLLTRVVEYVIAILLIIALMWVFTAFIITNSFSLR